MRHLALLGVVVVEIGSERCGQGKEVANEGQLQEGGLPVTCVLIFFPLTCKKLSVLTEHNLVSLGICETIIPTDFCIASQRFLPYFIIIIKLFFILTQGYFFHCFYKEGRERKKNESVASCTHPDQGLSP